MKKHLLHLAVVLVSLVIYSCGNDDEKDSPPPVACIELDTNSFSPGTEIIFTSCSENALNFKWSFGDGNTSFQDVARYTYDEPGRYHISLEVSDDQGNSDIDTTSVFIGQWYMTKVTTLNINFEDKNRLTASLYQYGEDGNVQARNDRMFTIFKSTSFPHERDVDILVEAPLMELTYTDLNDSIFTVMTDTFLVNDPQKILRTYDSDSNGVEFHFKFK